MLHPPLHSSSLKPRTLKAPSAHLRSAQRPPRGPQQASQQLVLLGWTAAHHGRGVDIEEAETLQLQLELSPHRSGLDHLRTDLETGVHLSVSKSLIGSGDQQGVLGMIAANSAAVSLPGTQ